MCEKCDAIDVRIDRCRRLAASVSDKLIVDRIMDLILKLEAEKAALHPRS